MSETLSVTITVLVNIKDNKLPEQDWDRLKKEIGNCIENTGIIELNFMASSRPLALEQKACFVATIGALYLSTLVKKLSSISDWHKYAEIVVISGDAETLRKIA